MVHISHFRQLQSQLKIENRTEFQVYKSPINTDINKFQLTKQINKSTKRTA